MRRSRRSAVQKYHDRVAPSYDDSYIDAFWQWHDALTWDYLKSFLPRDLSAHVIDLGCGTGTWGAKLANSGFRVTSVDVSGRMIDRARKKIEREAGADSNEFIRADLSDLSVLPAGRFALAVAMGEPIGCTPSPGQTLRQIRRILTGDGILVATFDNRLAAIDFYLGQGDPRALAHFLRDGKTHWLTKDEQERFPIVTYAPGQLRALVEAAGFAVLDLVGKTVLPMRHHRQLLATGGERRNWARVEKTLCRDPAAMGRAAHLQVACRVR